MIKNLKKANIQGTISAIASKSAAHRLYIAAALADGPTDIVCATTSKDIDATRACLDALINGGEMLYCGESGSTLRFLLPVAAALGRTVTFYMEGRLPRRPLAPLDEQLTAHGAVLSRPQEHLLTVSGKLRPGDYVLPGNVSSQYISGLLFALPLLDGPSTLTVTGTLESAPYVEMTLDALGKFGIKAPLCKGGSAKRWGIDTTPPSRLCRDTSPYAGEALVFCVEPQKYRSPGKVVVEGDWSNAAFWLCASALGGPVTVTGLDENSLQGDKAILDILRRFGANVTGSTVSAGKLTAIDLDAAEIPDLVPVVAIVAAAAQGVTTIYNAGRLRLKESDRIRTVCDMVSALGGRAEETEDGMKIYGGSLSGGTVDSVNDHRIAMAAAVASVLCPVTVTGAQAVEKSYPAFWNDLERMRKACPPCSGG